MKLLNFSLILLSFLIYLLNCKESKVNPEVALLATPTSISISAEGGTSSLTINNRFLVVQGYYTNIEYTNEHFVNPSDASNDR